MAKYIKNVNGALTEESSVAVSAGAASAARIPELDANGKLDISLFPGGLGADTQGMTASEALAAGDFVNIYDDAGTTKVRKADASNPAKAAHGYVLAGVASGASATVYFDDTNTGVTGQTGGPVYLSATTAGKSTNVAPTTAGFIVQRVGVATSATSVHVAFGPPITLA